MHIYGPNGEYQGSVSELSPAHYQMGNFLAVITVFGGIAWAAWKFFTGPLYKLWLYVANWSSLDWPDRIVAAYYYYLISLPIRGVGWLILVMTRNPLTPYPNLNMLLGVAAIIFAVLAVLVVLTILARAAKRRGVNHPYAIALIAPGACLGFWYAGVMLVRLASSLFSWLFTTS